MSQQTNSRMGEFKIRLQPLDVTSEEDTDSPYVFELNLDRRHDRWESTASDLSVNSNIRLEKLICVSSEVALSHHVTTVSMLMKQLGVEEQYKVLKLTPEQVSIFKFLNVEIRSEFSLSKATIHLAYTLFLQYSFIKRCDSKELAMASLFLASKYTETPFYMRNQMKDNFEEFIDEKIISLELDIWLTLKWNLMQTTLYEAWYSLLNSNSQFEKWLNFAENCILSQATFVIPLKFTKFIPREVLGSVKLSQEFILSLQDRQSIQMINKKRLRKSKKKKTQSRKGSSTVLKTLALSTKGDISSRLTIISEGLSSILKGYEVSDSDFTKTNSSVNPKSWWVDPTDLENICPKSESWALNSSFSQTSDKENRAAGQVAQEIPISFALMTQRCQQLSVPQNQNRIGSSQLVSPETVFWVEPTRQLKI